MKNLKHENGDEKINSKWLDADTDKMASGC